MGLTFIGAGLGCFEHLSLQAVEAIKKSDVVYLDTYTSIWAPDFAEKLTTLNSAVSFADRKLLEDHASKLVSEAVNKEVGIVVPGDPFIATTHLSLRILAVRKNIPVKNIHGTSVISSAISASGLHVYKFGKIVTVPKSNDPSVFTQVLRVVEDNLSRNLHTLLLLDTAGQGLTVPEALTSLLEAARESGKTFFHDNSLAVALARIGFPDFKQHASTVKRLIETKFPPPPHSIIIPAKLHFTEEEIIKTFSGETLLPATPNPVEERVKTYVSKCRRILGELSGRSELNEYVKYVSSYVDDAERFMRDGDFVNSLLAVGYAEGLLDGLRFLGRADFRW